MGILRFLLAISVVIDHSHPISGYKMVGGLVAVEAFFIISGFYMSLILNEKYIGKNSYRIFITNRFLRLYPLYWLVLFLSIITSLILMFGHHGGFLLQSFFSFYKVFKVSTLNFLIMTNILILGQDTVMFLKVNSFGGLSYTNNFALSNPPLYGFLLIPQAWSLGVELVFYTIAPAFVRKKILVILLLIFASLALRTYLYSIGLNYDPWTYRFFPTELAFFLFGALSYKLYRFINKMKISKLILLVAMIFVITYTLIYQYIPGESYKQWIYYLVLIILIPFIFLHTKDIKIIESIGNLSYPIYISHILVMNILDQLTNNNLVVSTIGVIGFTTLFSVFVIYIVEKPLKTIRQNRIKRLKREYITQDEIVQTFIN